MSGSSSAGRNLFRGRPVGFCTEYVQSQWLDAQRVHGVPPEHFTFRHRHSSQAEFFFGNSPPPIMAISR